MKEQQELLTRGRLGYIKQLVQFESIQMYFKIRILTFPGVGKLSLFMKPIMGNFSGSFVFMFSCF